MAKRKVWPEKRRRLVLAVLRDPERPRKELAAGAGISRSRLYQFVVEDTVNPEGALREAEANLAYRREVVRLLNEHEEKENG